MACQENPSICLNKHIKTKVGEFWRYTGRNSATVVPVEMVEGLLVGRRLDVLLVPDQLLLVLHLYHLGHLLPLLNFTFQRFSESGWKSGRSCHELKLGPALVRPCPVLAWEPAQLSAAREDPGMPCGTPIPARTAKIHFWTKCPQTWGKSSQNQHLATQKWFLATPCEFPSCGTPSQNCQNPPSNPTINGKNGRKM